MNAKNLYQKNTTSKNMAFIKKIGLLLLIAAVVLYLFLSVKFLIS